MEFVDAEPEKVRECLGNNAADTGVLTPCREMALRRMADRINKIAEKGEDVQETSYPGEHILTGISASPSNGRVIRTAARMADGVSRGVYRSGMCRRPTIKICRMQIKGY